MLGACGTWPAESVAAFVEHVSCAHGFGARVYLAGLSVGGLSVVHALASSAELAGAVAAALAVAPGCSAAAFPREPRCFDGAVEESARAAAAAVADAAAAHAMPPVLLTQSASDGFVGPHFARALAQAPSAWARLNVVNDKRAGEHDARFWAHAFTRDATYAWLLRHTRRDAGAAPPRACRDDAAARDRVVELGASAAQNPSRCTTKNYDDGDGEARAARALPSERVATWKADPTRERPPPVRVGYT